MRRCLIVLLTMCLIISAPARAEVTVPDIHTVELALKDLGLEPEQVEAEGYIDGLALRVALSDGLGEAVFAFVSEHELIFLFYADPEDYTVPEVNRNAYLQFLNQINALMIYPAVFLTDAGYPAGYGSMSFAADGAETLQLNVEQTMLKCEQVLSLLTASPYYSRLLPEPTPTPAKTPEVTFSPGPTPHPEYVYEDQVCPYCHGTGSCPLCHGTGTYRLYGVSVDCEKVCSYCNGNKTVRVLVLKWVYD